MENMTYSGSPLPLTFSPYTSFPLAVFFWRPGYLPIHPPPRLMKVLARLGKGPRGCCQSSPGTQWDGWAICQPDLTGLPGHPVSSSSPTEPSINKLMIPSCLPIHGCYCWLPLRETCVLWRGLDSSGDGRPPPSACPPSSTLIFQLPRLAVAADWSAETRCGGFWI